VIVKVQELVDVETTVWADAVLELPIVIPVTPDAGVRGDVQGLITTTSWPVALTVTLFMTMFAAPHSVNGASKSRLKILSIILLLSN
jgi:hypothetical protein